MSTNTAAHEAATIEAMHTGDYTPDLEYTPITDPLPALVRREELDAARDDLAACAVMLRHAAHVLRICGQPQTARLMNGQAERVTARWAVQP